MPLANELSDHFSTSVREAFGVVTERAGDQVSIMLDAAACITRYQSDLALAISDRSKNVAERAVRDGGSSLEFLRKVADQGTEAAKSLSTAKVPGELLKVQVAYAQSTAELFSKEISASANRLMEAMAYWTSWRMYTAAEAVS